MRIRFSDVKIRPLRGIATSRQDRTPLNQKLRSAAKVPQSATILPSKSDRLSASGMSTNSSQDQTAEPAERGKHGQSHDIAPLRNGKAVLGQFIEVTRRDAAQEHGEHAWPEAEQERRETSFHLIACRPALSAAHSSLMAGVPPQQ